MTIIFCMISIHLSHNKYPTQKKNTGISMKGSPEGKWKQFLYTRGSKSGQVSIFYVSLNYSEIPQFVLGEEDVHVFPYSEEGGWDFEACKV